MLRLAERCEIRIPEIRIDSIGAESVLLLRRFDREKTEGGYLRHRMASGLTMLDADDSGTDLSNWSYLLLADELGRWSSRPDADREELFRRMVFNAAISNNDDHPRNHAVLAASRDWRLAPAYDLTPAPQHSQERSLALTCGARGRAACRDNLVSAAARFGLTAVEANAMIDRIRDTVRRFWYTEVRAQGGSQRDCDRVASAFLHEGFEFGLAESYPPR